MRHNDTLLSCLVLAFAFFIISLDFFILGYSNFVKSKLTPVVHRKILEKSGNLGK